MTTATLALVLLKVAASFWHVAAFGIGLLFVVRAYQALFGWRDYDPSWNPVLRRADIHLWLSGLAIIVIGIGMAGAEKYLSNPKLWSKGLVVAVWTMTTLLMRTRSGVWFRDGKRIRIAILAGVSIGSWIYGAILGLARDLAYGVMPFQSLAAGYVLTVLTAVIASLILEEGRRVSARANPPPPQASGKY